MDMDFKDKYTVAVAVFTIFFVLLIVISGLFICKFIKTRKVLLSETKALQTFEA